MADVVGTSASRGSGGGVDELESQRTVDGDAGMQCARWLPRPEADSTHLDVGVAGSQQRDRIAVGGDHVAVPVGADEPNLEALDRRVDVAGRAACRGFLTEDV